MKYIGMIQTWLVSALSRPGVTWSRSQSRSHLSCQTPGVKMTLADDKELLVMLSQQRHEERRTRYLWFLTIILAFTASQLCLCQSTLFNEIWSFQPFFSFPMSIRDQDTQSASILTPSPSGQEAGLTPVFLRTILMTDPLLVVLPLSGHFTIFF